METCVSGIKPEPFKVNVHVLVVALVAVGLMELRTGAGLLADA
jgi:hypothetical protein